MVCTGASPPATTRLIDLTFWYRSLLKEAESAMSLTDGEVIGDVLTQKLQLRLLRLHYRVRPQYLPLLSLIQ